MKIGKTTIITESAKVTASIASIDGRGKKLDADIHKTGVSCMYHAQQFGDVTLMQNLIMALPKSARRKGFIAWVDAHMPVAAETDNKTGAVTLSKDRTEADFKLDGAEASPFWMFTKEPNVVPLTLNGMIAAFRKQVTKAAKQEGESEVDASKLALLESAFSTALGENVEEFDAEVEVEVEVAKAA